MNHVKTSLQDNEEYGKIGNRQLYQSPNTMEDISKRRAGRGWQKEDFAENGTREYIAREKTTWKIETKLKKRGKWRR